MSHFKGGGRLGENSLREAGCYRKVQRSLKVFINKGGERRWFLGSYRKGGRRQAKDIKEGGGRSDLYDILLLTICKLYKKCNM